MHYCGELLSKVSVVDKSPTCCGDDEPMGCCHNESNEFSFEEKFNNLVYSYEINQNEVKFELISPIDFSSPLVNESTDQVINDHDPPPLIPVNNQSVLQVFII